MEKISVCVSGYFDPLHKGHLEYISKSREHGNWLIVIVNNDEQAKLKKGTPFMNQEDRFKLVSELKNVDEVVMSIDKDRTVCQTLKLIRPNIFANGGDQFNDLIPEKSICDELGITLIDGIGCKIDSSRSLVKHASMADFKADWIGDRYDKKDRPWGWYERILPSTEGYQIKRLCLYPGKSISLQKHKYRSESWTIVEGEASIRVGDNISNHTCTNVIDIPVGALHKATNIGDTNLVIIEVQIGSYLGEDDIERFDVVEGKDGY